ncbi:GNAT family N-acetyltransferase [Streptomyces sp. WMMB 322]|uniref:GNAT family N-acetyltransferase n=1 Tax=Streptomyces sp. WMMB 322 TaxID=1286821 RepID=UPI0006E24F17|nr:GNAT family N-acetyltransferase [Streptomyces sp. WMMB 322]SCK19063.1 Acetyltransferase (GNAT) family protein [Streptomyces sp. WMMB 322]
MTETEIRLFAEADRTELRQLFRRAGAGAATASLWGHEESEAEIYLRAYMDLEPESLFVAVVDGAPAGYLAGSLDPSRFPSESERIARAIKKHRLALRPRPAAFLARSVLDLGRAALRGELTASDFSDERWPAHLHINVVPEARGTGASDGLMNAWFRRLRAGGSPGCHLLTLAENTRAVRFFERMGFTKYGATPLVPGIRHEGRRVHQQAMVWSP